MYKSGVAFKGKKSKPNFVKNHSFGSSCKDNTKHTAFCSHEPTSSLKRERKKEDGKTKKPLKSPNNP
jgi:hypothetical protein